MVVLTACVTKESVCQYLASVVVFRAYVLVLNGSVRAC